MAVNVPTPGSDRGQGSPGRLAKFGVAFIVALTVAAILAAALLPVVINEVETDDSQTITQDVGETVNVTPVFDSTLDSTNAGTNATYTLDDVENSSETNTIAVGSEATFNLDSGDVTVNVSAANAGDATSTFTYSSTHGWSTGAVGLWGILGILIVLTVFLFVLGVALKAVEGV